jgi:hypothetical protein
MEVSRICPQFESRVYNSELSTTGSYGGMLAILLRQQYPETVWGTIASSPLMEGFGTDIASPAKFKFTDFVRGHQTLYEISRPHFAVILTDQGFQSLL